MSYIQNNLMNRENLLYSAKLHWVVFVWPAVWFVVAIMLFCGGNGFAVAGLIFIIIAILTGIVAFVNYAHLEFGEHTPAR